VSGDRAGRPPRQGVADGAGRAAFKRVGDKVDFRRPLLFYTVFCGFLLRGFYYGDYLLVNFIEDDFRDKKTR
jgi:hypothetical protein